MSHEENKNDSQVYSPAINTINFILIIDRHSFIRQHLQSPTARQTCAGHGGLGVEKTAGLLILSSSHPGAGVGQALNRSGMAVYLFPRAV